MSSTEGVSPRMRLVLNFLRVMTGLTLLVATQLNAQPTDTRWRFHAEAGMLGGAEWLTGSSAPTVRSAAAPFGGIGAVRRVAQHVALGAIVRAHTMSISLTENDVEWSGGKVSEGMVLGTLSYDKPRLQSVRIGFDLRAGVSIREGANRIVPFHPVSYTAVGEAGISAHVPLSEFQEYRRVLAAFVRYNITHVSFDGDLHAADGAVKRVVAGVSFTL